MSGLQVFNYQEIPVRVVEQADGPWWVLADVCKVLGLTTPAKVAERLDDDEKGVSPIHTLGGAQQMTIINEPGLYSVILRSDKPEAKAFKRWITHEVLPAIRQTGGYGETPQVDVETLVRCAEIVSGCSDASRSYVVRILRKVVPDLEVELPATQGTAPAFTTNYTPRRKTKLSHYGFDIPFDHEKLASVLTERGISNQELGRRIETYPNTVGKWRRGIVAPVAENRNRICDALGLPRGYFDK